MDQKDQRETQAPAASEQPAAASEKEQTPLHKGPKINMLQKYIIIFGVVALILILMASFFQYRLNQNTENYENIISQKDNTLLSKTSMMQDLQSQMDELTKDYEKMKSSYDAQKTYLTTLESEFATLQARVGTLEVREESAQNLAAASTAYIQRKYTTARKYLALVDPEALTGRETELYNDLAARLN